MMLRSVIQVSRPVCETATVHILRCSKMTKTCKFSTMVSNGRCDVSFIRKDGKTTYKRFLRYIRGSSRYRPQDYEFQDENQETTTTRRRNEESEIGNTENRYDPEVRHKSTEVPPIATSSKVVKEMLRNSTSFSDITPMDSPLRDWSTEAYPKAESRRLQASKAIRPPKIDPMETSIILFPGQGVQYPGMGKRLLKYPNVSRIYKHASEILGYDLLDVCLNGTREELQKTIYSQPAIVVTSLAAVEKLRDEAPHAIATCVAVAGFSVGEITALMFAGAISFTDGIKLVRIRAEAMQGASEMEAGGMMTVFFSAGARINFACHAAKEWCKKKGIEDPVCNVANYLYPDCKVIAGNEEALKFISLNARDFGVRRIKRLPVSGAFHTRLMSPAREALQMAMESIKIKKPVISVHSNYDGGIYRDEKHIKRQLPKQVCAPVKWEQTLHVLYEREIGTSFPKTYECGPGRSMTAILEKVNSKAFDCTTVVDSN